MNKDNIFCIIKNTIEQEKKNKYNREQAGKWYVLKMYHNKDFYVCSARAYYLMHLNSAYTTALLTRRQILSCDLCECDKQVFIVLDVGKVSKGFAFDYDKFNKLKVDECLMRQKVMDLAFDKKLLAEVGEDYRLVDVCDDFDSASKRVAEIKAKQKEIAYTFESENDNVQKSA
ncbi:MAG: hypothetical protein IJ301_00860 [Clostridia bacterium]|nr:hypothetical protein [Clostridia bacterium]